MIADDRLERVLPRAAVALTGDLIRAVLWTAVALGWLAVVMVYARLGSLLYEGGANDFTIFYYTARMVAEGHPMYGDLPREYGLTWEASHLGNLNPPHFELLLVPLVPLGYRGALIVWGILNAALVAASLWMLAREAGAWVTRKRALVVGMAIFGSAPWTAVITTGEMSLLLLLPFTCAWIAWRRGRWGAAGAWLGVCVSVKLFFLLFLVWFAVHRRWRAVFAATGVTALLVLAGGLAFGFHTYVEWTGSLGKVGWWWLPMNVSLRGAATRLFDSRQDFAPVVDAPVFAVPAWIVLTTVIGAASLWQWRRGGLLADDPDRAATALLVLALLVSPLGWVYYLPLATGPLILWLIRRPLEWTRPVTALACLATAGLFMPPEVTEAAQPSRVATLLLGSAYSWGALSLWGLTTWVRRERG